MCKQSVHQPPPMKLRASRLSKCFIKTMKYVLEKVDDAFPVVAAAVSLLRLLSP